MIYYLHLLNHIITRKITMSTKSTTSESTDTSVETTPKSVKVKKPKAESAKPITLKSQDMHDTIKILAEAKKRMTSWAAGMSRRKDTQKKVRATIDIRKASEYVEQGGIPFGIPSLDITTRGGTRYGRHHVFFGGPGAGKSATMAELIKSAQSIGIAPLLLAPETPDLDWMEQQGVDMEHLMYSPEVDSSRILNTVDEVARGTSEPETINPEGPITKLIIVDSVAAMKHIEEANKGAGGDDMALTARRLSRFFRSQNDGIVRNRPVVVWVNQLREKDLGSGGGMKLESYPGGNALMHYSALDINVRRGGKTSLRNEGAYNRIFSLDGDKIGFPNVYTVRKTKFFGVPEWSTAVGTFIDGLGFQKEYCLAEFILSSGVGTIASNGKTVTIPIVSGTDITTEEFGGYDSFYEYLCENYELVYFSADFVYRQSYTNKLQSRTNKLHGINQPKAEEAQEDASVEQPSN